MTNDGSLPAGFLDPSTDRDNFKIEVQDSTIKGNTIPASAVEVEVLRKNKRSFKSPRKIHVELQRVGTSNIFRSRYIRAVVDDLDQASVLPPNQTILTDWDEDHPLEEIRAKWSAPYSYTDCGESPDDLACDRGERPEQSNSLYCAYPAQERWRGTEWLRSPMPSAAFASGSGERMLQISLAPYLINTHYVDLWRI